uniref:Uncharacterized protein n=1 Tax=Aegilops tauschii subsp. strangulata TaxID=200361 RepID=A0A453CWR8_AEGTS
APRRHARAPHRAAWPPPSRRRGSCRRRPCVPGHRRVPDHGQML